MHKALRRPGPFFPRTAGLASVPMHRSCPECGGHQVRLIRKTLSHSQGRPSTETLVCGECHFFWLRELTR